MREENRVKLEGVRHVLENRGGGSEDVNKVLEVIRDEWDAHYSVNMFCDACKMKMVEYAFAKMKLETK